MEIKVVDKATLYLEDILEDAFYFLQHGDAKQGKYLLKKAAKKYPRHYLTYYGVGIMAVLKGDYNLAIQNLLKSIAVNGEYALAHYNLAISYQKTGKVDLSIKHHVAALKHASPEDTDVITASKEIVELVEKGLPTGFTIEQYLEDSERFDKGFELLQTEQYEKAIPLFKVIASNQPKHVQAKGNLGICYLMLQDYTQARDYFEQALALDPDYEPAKKNLAVLNNIETGLLSKPLSMQSTYFYAEKAARANKIT
ncbi:MAG TPA: tetratricopeptide repeat protein [Pseudoalteromonas prydzensis]|uniref:Tetratricopeptide repeat protein n=1 Tax=Pseudoalteromonas prydzensis TaxID=182141 RepID=A0A7V1GCY6_9GAMM|nr:tetratricopeptide repeat protein [Pseudoalteromonas prydzensis]